MIQNVQLVTQEPILKQEHRAVVHVLEDTFGIVHFWLVKDVWQDSIPKVEVFHVAIVQRAIIL